jgi:hypothetical protein
MKAAPLVRANGDPFFFFFFFFFSYSCSLHSSFLDLLVYFPYLKKQMYAYEITVVCV